MIWYIVSENFEDMIIEFSLRLAIGFGIYLAMGIGIKLFKVLFGNYIWMRFYLALWYIALYG